MRSMLSRLASMTAAAALAAVVASSPMPQVAAAATSGPQFGMAAHLMWYSSTADAVADLDRMRHAGMTYVRFDVSWRNMEPSKGTYRYFDKLDTILNAISARGMTLTMAVIDTPGWANGWHDANYPPYSMSDYASFVGALARHNAWRSGMVYEVWNEEDDPHWWTSGPNVARYTSMLKAAYPAIKSADPDATVLVGGILANDINYFNGIYANGGGNSFDGVAVHPYTVNYPPYSTSSTWFSFKLSVPQYTTAMANHGQNKPIWLTEFGWSTDYVSDSTRAQWFKDAVTITRGWSNVRGVAAYTMRQSQFWQFGLIRTDGSTTLSWQAYDSMFPNP